MVSSSIYGIRKRNGVIRIFFYGCDPKDDSKTDIRESNRVKAVLVFRLKRKRKGLAPLGNKFFSLRVHLYLGRDWYAGNQTGSKSACLTCKMVANPPGVSSYLTHALFITIRT